MNQEQKFDKIIKKKVDEAEFPFDEQNWNKLSMQLDAERRLAASKGWGKFLFLGLLFLGITSASIALYKIQGPMGFKDKLAGNITSNVNGTSTQAHGVNENKTSITNSQNKLLALNDKNNTTSETVNDATTTSNVTSAISLASDASNNVLTSNGSASEKNNKTVSSGEINVNATSNQKNNSEKTAKYNSSAKAINHMAKNNLSGSKESEANNGEANGMVSPDKTYSGLAGGISLEHNVLDRIDARIPVSFSNRNVKLGALKIPNWYEEDYHKIGKKRLSFLNAEAGGAFMTGWDSKAGKDGRGLNWYAGVNYGKFINRKIGFSVGAQCYNIGNIKQPFYESSKSVYGLGSTSSNTVITTQSLSYFSVPVKFYYAIKPAHQVGVGVNSSFLFSSNNIIETYRLTDNIRSNESKVKTSGIYEGVRLNNILVSAFYKVKINKRMFVNAEAVYGLRDIFKNTNTNNYIQKPLGFRLGLQYTLFEK